jgi:long-chain acyl-CoA synthetase
MPYPFDRSGTEVGPDGIRRYTGLPENLLHTLRTAADQVEPGQDCPLTLRTTPELRRCTK